MRVTCNFPVCIHYRLVCFVSVDVVFYLGIFLFGAKWHNNEEGPLEDSCNLGAKSDEVQSIIIYLAILCTKIARVTYIVVFF